MYSFGVFWAQNEGFWDHFGPGMGTIRRIPAVQVGDATLHTAMTVPTTSSEFLRGYIFKATLATTQELFEDMANGPNR